jgi:muramoyltetrapeptide carboxypeptidase LdcA involved in peptidoglycan recycling
MQEQEIYDKTKAFVIASFQEAKKDSKINHHLRTAAIINILKPKADIPLLTAAISHDIEKAFRSTDALKEKE